MRAGDSFTIVNRGKISFDAETFTLLYLPIVGSNAFALYQLLTTFSTGRISHFLEYLNIGLNPFLESLDKLSGLGLVKVFDDHTMLYFDVKSPLTYDEFLSDDFYKQLLISRIGENRVTGLSKKIEVKGQNISKKFHEVYKVDFDNEPKAAVSTDSFDMGAFELMMKDSRNNLGKTYHFQDEVRDKLSLYSMAEKYELNWFQLLNLAMATAYKDGALNILELTKSLSQQQSPLPKLSEFPPAFAELVNSAKEGAQSVDKYDNPSKRFLSTLKKSLGGFVSGDENWLVDDLKNNGLPPEVINVLIHYLLVQQKQPSLNKTLVNRIANEWKQNSIYSAELAVRYIIERPKIIAQRAKEKAKKNQNNFTKTVKAAPEWSDPNYEETISQSEITEFEKLQAERKKRRGDK